MAIADKTKTTAGLDVVLQERAETECKTIAESFEESGVIEVAGDVASMARAALFPLSYVECHTPVDGGERLSKLVEKAQAAARKLECICNSMVVELQRLATV